MPAPLRQALRPPSAKHQRTTTGEPAFAKCCWSYHSHSCPYSTALVSAAPPLTAPQLPAASALPAAAKACAHGELSDTNHSPLVSPELGPCDPDGSYDSNGRCDSHS